MQYLKHAFDQGGEAYYNWCPACSAPHRIQVKGSGDNWEFSGDLISPTFTPSARVLGTDKFGAQVTICHYSIASGQIVFGDDSPHSYAGLTVPLPPYPPDWL